MSFNNQVNPQHAPPPVYAPPAPRAPRGLAISALIVGIVAFLFGLIPVLGIILGAAGMVFGIVALVKKQPKSLALTGLILAICALIASCVTTAGLGAAVDAASKLEQSATSEEPAQTEEPVAEPVAEPEPEPVTPDLSSFYETDERTLALLAKDPNAYAGSTLILYGKISQWDNFTGKCGFRMDTGAILAEHSFDYKHNTYITSGDGETECPILDQLVEDDIIKMWITVDGAYDYDTTIGGTATSILGTVWAAELMPELEY